MLHKKCKVFSKYIKKCLNNLDLFCTITISSAGEDDRAVLWIYKTTVAFPVKFSDPGILLPFSRVPKEPIHSTAASAVTAASVTASTKPVGAESVPVTASTDPYQSKEVVSHILANEAPPVFLPVEDASVEASSKGSVPGKVPAPAMTMDDDLKAAMFSSMLEDSAAEELSSSSSSDSETDSECDLEEKILVIETENRSFSLELQQTGHKRGESAELKVTGVTKGITDVEEESVKAVDEAPRDNSQHSVFVIPTASKGATELTNSEFSIDAAPTVTDAQYEFPAVVVSQKEIPEKAQSNSHFKEVDVLTECGDDLGNAAKESWEKATIGPVKAETVTAKDVAAGHPVDIGPSANSTAELVDSFQVLVEDIGEELHVETTAEQTEGIHYTTLPSLKTFNFTD